MRKIITSLMIVLALCWTSVASQAQPTIVLGPFAAVSFPDGFGIHGIGGDDVLLFGVQPESTAHRPSGIHVARRVDGQLLGDLAPPPGGWQVPLGIKIAEYHTEGLMTEGSAIVLDAGANPGEAGTRPGVVYRYR